MKKTTNRDNGSGSCRPKGGNTSKSQDATVIEGPRDGREDWKRAVIAVAMIANTILRRRYSGHAKEVRRRKSSDGEGGQTEKEVRRRK